ncbi:hypothetical protein KAU19_07055 [Candidatus Parcubacteria bacterium]|nr:hypothetical protein [Candidatus Parcubacteria bacterium]
MKKTNILIAGSAALVALVAVAGIAFSAMATDNTSENTPLFRHFQRQNLTEEERAEKRAQMEERRAEMQSKHKAAHTALGANDYQAWVEAVGEDCPMAEKINEGNFNRLVEAHELREQARSIMEELGVEQKGFGQKRHFMRGWNK